MPLRRPRTFSFTTRHILLCWRDDHGSLLRQGPLFSLMNLSLPISLFRSTSFLALAVFALTACQPQQNQVEIAGQVFIVVPSGESMRLGSVEVLLFGDSAIAAHLKATEARIAQQQMTLGQRVAELEKELAIRQTALAEAEALYARRETEIRAELTAAVESAEAKARAITTKIASNKTFIVNADTVPAPPSGVPTREEFEEYSQRRTKWLSMSRTERQAWAQALTSMNGELEVSLQNLAAERDRQVYAWADELRAADEKIQSEGEAVGKAQAALAAAQEKLAPTPKHEAYLADLPKPLREIRTDADGEFTLTLPAGERYAIVARAERMIGGHPTEFRWFIWAAPGQAGRKLLLSNHNVITSEAADNVVRLPKPKPAPNPS
jgi:hypothetical protein